MQQSIGERLEEARKRKGISLREASEATKIRSDFLRNFEQDKFDFDLPDIYKRGFVKNYANYLKLDSQKLLTDYSALLLSNPGNVKKGGSELFGSMNTEVRTASDTAESPSYGKISAKSPVKEPEEEDAKLIQNIDSKFYIKIGLVASGALFFVFVIFGLIKAVLGGDEETAVEKSETETSSATAESTTSTGQNGLITTNEEPITLKATGNVYVLIKQRKDNKELVRKTLGEGEMLTFRKSGPIDILFTASEHLVIINSEGERLNPKSKGTAKITIP